jgi:glycosyltransferase involved in cell wall biosynthesis
MMHNPLISVVLSVYNAEPYLVEAIESILNQTYENFEFIIINDGSTDRSLKIIKSYDDKRIICISRENKGLIASLNEGIQKARGKYIVRMDADDISLPKRFEAQVAFMEKNQDIDLCGTSVTAFGDNIKSNVWKPSKDNKTIQTQLLFSSPLFHPTVIMRRDVILKYDLLYDEKFKHAEDFELWSRFAKYTKISNIQKPLLKYRILTDSITREADKDIEHRYQTIKTIFENYLKDLGIENSEEENRLHFNLTVNTRIRDNNIEFTSLKKYFDKIKNANSEKHIFNTIELKKVLGKKWLWNLYYKKEIKGCFSEYLFYGIWSILSK